MIWSVSVKMLSFCDVDAVKYLYGGGGCTYTAFLEERCQHKYYIHSAADGRQLSICLHCHVNCYPPGDKATLVEANDEGFTCACEKNHANDPYIIHIDEYKSRNFAQITFPDRMQQRETDLY
jgi:hypothetical protein